MQKSKILIIEDETDLLSLLTFRLTKAGYTIIGAGDGKQGIYRFKKHKPDLLILDLVLPGISGLDILRHIKKDKNTALIPVIILTAQFIDTGLEQELLDYPLVRIIRKPYESGNLISNISECLA